MNEDIKLLMEALLFSLWKQQLLTKAEMDHALSVIVKSKNDIGKIVVKDDNGKRI